MNALERVLRDLTAFVSKHPLQLLFVEVLQRPIEFTTYASGAYQDALEQNYIICSMSRKGNCWDNAVVESFFSTLDFECGDQKSFPSHEAAHRAVAAYILGFYNPTRLHSYLGYRSPMEFEREAA